MSSRAKGLVAVGFLLAAVVAFVLFNGRRGPLGKIFEPATCPLTAEEPREGSRLERPAVAVKVGNSPAAYPLSGLEKADVVYEERVEGGLTRFLALYHCADVKKVGPVRSSRAVDAAIMAPYTRILAAAGGNDAVRSVLGDAGVIIVDEGAAGSAMRRIQRPGIASEHTLFANVAGVRKIGQREFDDPPSGDIFEFGKLEGRSRPARSITIDFGGAASVGYRWSNGGWLRLDGGSPLPTESGKQIVVQNVLIEEHRIDLSKEITDRLGAPSIEIANVTGSGRAVLFRDGRAVAGRWERSAEDEPVEFTTRDGETMLFAPGSIWIELVPDQKGEVKGSFSFAR